MSRAQLTSTVEQNTGGAVSPYVAGKNAVINGGFDIWQRGTSFSSLATGSYSADRWCAETGGTTTISQQTTGVPAGSLYVLRASSGAASSYVNMWQGLEAAEAAKLQGQTVTFSVKLRKSSTFVTSSLQIAIYKNATANLNPVNGAGGVSINSTTVSNATLPTGTGSSNWYTATVTAVIPNDGTANGIMVRINQTATDASGSYWEMGQAQLELGSVATPFSRAGGTLSGELAACQRYYYRTTLSASSAAIIGFGTAQSTTTALIGVRLPVTMRTYPSSTVESSGLWIYDGATTINTSAGITSGGGVAPDPNIMNIVATGTGLVQYRPYYLYAATTSAYLGITAEL